MTKVKKSLIEKFRMFSGFMIILLLVLTGLYINRINFGGKVEICAGRNNNALFGLSPLNKIIPFTYKDSLHVFNGYLNSIVIESSSDIAVKDIVVKSNGSTLNNCKFNRISSKKLKIYSEDLSFIGKANLFLKYNWSKLALLSLFFLIYIYSLIYTEKVYSSIFEFFNNLWIKIKVIVFIVKKEWKRIILSFIIVIFLLSGIRLLFGIKFEELYFANFWSINTIVFVLLLIPVVGIFFNKYFKTEKLFSFFSFWIIVILLYFFVCPQDFVGNYGFHGFFHDYIVKASSNGFFSNLFIPDTGYLALIPRISYSLASLTDKYGADSIAITSIISLFIYAWIFSLLTKRRFQFLIENDYLRSGFFIFMAVFSVFTLSLSRHYALSVTDVAYYGVIFILICIFRDFTITTKANLLLLVLVSGLFVFSKVHLMVVIPVIFVYVIYLINKKKYKTPTLFYLATVLLFGLIHIIFIYFSFKQMQSNPEAVASFSLDEKSPILLLGFSIVYFVKSYLYLIFPFINVLGGVLGYIVFVFGVLLFGFLLWYAYLIYKKGINNKLAMWFFAANIIAFVSTILMIRTLPAGNKYVFTYNFLWEYITYGNIMFSRYSIAIHTVLAFSVLPLILHYVKSKFKVFKLSNRTFKLELLVLLFIITYSSVFHVTPKFNLRFWKKANSEKWSEEWYLLSRNIANSSFYIPIVFYPNRKQHIQTDDLQMIYDTDSCVSDYIYKPNQKVSTVIVINNPEISEHHPDINLNLITIYGDSLYIKPDYPVREYYKFIVFNIKKPVEAKNIKFVNETGIINQPEKYRVVGIKL